MEFSDKDRAEAKIYSLKHLLERLMSRVGEDHEDEEVVPGDMSVEVAGEDPEAVAEGLDKAKELLGAVSGEEPVEGPVDPLVEELPVEDEEDELDEDELKSWKRRFR